VVPASLRTCGRRSRSRLPARFGAVALAAHGPSSDRIPAITGSSMDAGLDADLPDARDGDLSAAPGVPRGDSDGDAVLAIPADSWPGTRPTLIVRSSAGWLAGRHRRPAPRRHPLRTGRVRPPCRAGGRARILADADSSSSACRQGGAA